MNQTKGFIALTSTALILGTFGIWIRELALTFSNSGQVFARSLAATLIISLIILFQRTNPFSIARKNLKYILLFGTVFPLSIICFTFSANAIKVSNSLFMLYVGSLISTAIYGKVLFKEKFTLKHLISLVLVIIGLCFFVYPFSINSLSMGLIFGILSGILEGSSHTLRKLMKDIKREVIVFWQSFSSVIVAIIFLLISTEPFIKEFHLSALFVAILFGGLLVSIGSLLVYGFSNFDVNLGTIILATELFFALVINYIFLKETPTTFELIGGIIIFLGSILTSLNIKKSKKALITE